MPPPVCSVVLDGSNITDVTNGEYKQKVYYGTHTYQITAERYHSLEDTITINSSRPISRTVQLKQAWGWLQFANASDLADAKLFIDGEAKGNITSEPIDVNSGEHTLKIVKPLYENYETEFTIKDSETSSLSPSLIKNYGHVQLSVADEKSTIYVDGETTGTNIANMDLGSGEHVVECRRPSHSSTFKTITVTTGSNNKYELDNPVPIYGSLAVNTGNVAVNVQIDDEKPTGSATNNYRNDKVLIGSHKVTLSQKGYRTEVEEVTIAKDSLSEVKREMLPIVRVHFQSKPKAILTVDSIKLGWTPVDTVLRAGKHKVELYTYGYSSYSGTEKFTTDEQTFSKSLLRIFYGKNEAYIEGGGYAGSMMGYYGAIGMYIHNINFEGIYAGYLGSKETVYQTYTDGYDDNIRYIGTRFYEIKPKYYAGGRIGYGIKLGGAWRLTPQVGGGVWSIDEYDGTTYVATGTAGLKLQICLCKCVSIVLKPEYTMTVTKGKDYEKLSEVSSKIKDWGQGFNISVGFNFYY